MPWCDRVRREMKRYACTQVQCYLRAQTKKTADGGGPRRRRRKNKRENAGGRRKEEEEEEVGSLDCPLAAAAGAGHSSQATPCRTIACTLWCGTASCLRAEQGISEARAALAAEVATCTVAPSCCFPRDGIVGDPRRQRGRREGINKWNSTHVRTYACVRT